MPLSQDQKPLATTPREITPILFQRLFIFNIIWSILGIYADWNWLTVIPSYLIPFTIICSLYPALLAIIFFFLLKKTQPPQILLWLTSIGLISYGIMAQIYFPLLMTWKGINFHDIASMFWVAAYGLQFFIIKKYLKPLPTVQILMIIGYFIIVNSSHYFYPTFIDFILPNYPIWLKTTSAICLLTLQCFALYTTWKIANKNSTN